MKYSSIWRVCWTVLSIMALAFHVQAQPGQMKNTWTQAPQLIPNDASIDAPLMGNGSSGMTLGYQNNTLSYYLSRNDFWRLLSQATDLSGPRTAARLDIRIEGMENVSFSAEQLLQNGETTTILSSQNPGKLKAISWVAATEDLALITLSAEEKEIRIQIGLTAPENRQAIIQTGQKGNLIWLTRSFRDSVDIPTEVAIGLKLLGSESQNLVLKPGKPVTIALSLASNFSAKIPTEAALKRLKHLDESSLPKLQSQHRHWWDEYWRKSNVQIDDPLLMKAWYQGLYTMAASSRDPKFPPGLFGWTTTDKPAWNGDYHLNYNFQSSFYSLHTSNRLEQAIPHDAPLLDFMERGKWYAREVTQTRGILYPVGIGPLGVEVTRNFAVGGYQKPTDIEHGGLFYGQRSNAAYGLVNMAQYWRCTYDLEYGRKIYPYALAVIEFWEDYLDFENGRYVINGDAIHEGSGLDKNPILTLGLLRNSLDLILDLSTSLGKDTDRQAKWREILAHLSEYPTQVRNGKEVFRYTEVGVAWWPDNGLGIQHIYPSSGITPDSPEKLLKVAENTFNEMQRWQDFNTTNSFYVAALRIRYDRKKILEELQKYARHTYPNGFLLNNPHGIENSCTVTNALNEMFLMSVGHVIRVFDQFPAERTASFENLRAWGAFLVSARFSKGEVSDLRLLSEKGKTCQLVNPWPNRKVQVVRNGKKAETMEGLRLTFETAEGEIIELISV